MSGGSTDWDAEVLGMCSATDRGSAARAEAPLFDGCEQTLRLDPGEQLIGALRATDLSYRVPAGGLDLRWGPLPMRVTLTSRRIVLLTTAAAGGAAVWSVAPDGAPLVLHIIEPAGTHRGCEPVRIAGDVRWDRVSRVDAEGSLIRIVMPVPTGRALLALNVPGQLAHRVLAAARAAFVDARRVLTLDTPFRIDAERAQE